MIGKFIKFSVLLLIGTHFVFGQAPPLDFELFNTSSGLPSNRVNRVFQDARGYVWIGTYSGLTRYDGYTFKTFYHDPADSSSLLHSFISDINQDREGKLWVSYYPSGLSYLDPVNETFVHFRSSNNPGKSITDKYISKIFIDSQNTIWLGLYTENVSNFHPVLIKLDPKSGTSISYGPLPDLPKNTSESLRAKNNSIHDIVEDENGFLWLVTDAGLYSFNKLTGEFTPVRKGDWNHEWFLKLVYDLPTGLWIASGCCREGLFNYDIKNKEWRQYLLHSEKMNNSISSNVAYDIFRKNKDELWCIVEFKLYIFNIPQKKFTRIDDPLFNNKIEMPHAIYEDHQNNLWVSHSQGLSLNRKRSNLFTSKEINVTHSGNSEYYEINKIVSNEKHNSFLVATRYADGLYEINSKNNSISHYPIPIAPFDEEKYQNVNDIVVDKFGTRWIVTRNYIFKFNDEKKKLELLKLSPELTACPHFYRAVFDDQGFLWVVSARKGIFKINVQNSNFTNYITQTPSDFFECIAKDNKGRVWFGTDAEGLIVYDQYTEKFSTKVHNPKDPNSLVSNAIRSIATNQKGDLYVATDIGIDKFTNGNPNGKFEHLGLMGPNGFDGTVVNGSVDMLFEDNDFIWYTAQDGVHRYNINTKSNQRFTEANGIPGYYFNFRLSKVDNEILLGTFRKYYSLNLTSLNKTRKHSSIEIQSLKVLNNERKFGKELQSNKKITLRPDENFFSFEFSAPEISEPGNLNYSYKLEGFDRDWIQCKGKGFASYTNLDGGDYVFKARCSIDNVAQESVIEIPVYIEIPFYKSTLFFVTISVVAFMLLAGSIKQYVGSLLRRQKKEAAFARRVAELQMEALRSQINPHFLFNALNSVNRFIITKDTLNANIYLTKVSKLIRIILENSRSKTVSLADEIAILRMYIDIERIRLEDKFDFNIEVDPCLNQNITKLPSMIIQPYVENAIWHGIAPKLGRGKLDIDFTKVDNFLKVTVRDNGAGRKKTVSGQSDILRKESLGGKITEERIRIINLLNKQNSSIQVNDLIDKDGLALGTEVQINLSLNYYESNSN